MFRASLRPSSGEQTACHGLWCAALVVAVVVPVSRVARCAHISLPDTPEPQQLQPGQNTISRDTQSALLMMGVKTPETC